MMNKRKRQRNFAMCLRRLKTFDTYARIAADYHVSVTRAWEIIQKVMRDIDAKQLTNRETKKLRKLSKKIRVPLDTGQIMSAYDEEEGFIFHADLDLPAE